jgi:hypothetical protein
LTADANCTGCRTPRPQWTALHVSPGQRPPVTVLKNGNRVGLRHEIGECFLEFFGGRLHQRVMEGMIDADESSEDALRLHLGEHCFERNARAGEGQRTRAIDGGDRDGAVVARDQRTRFIFAQTQGEHGAFAARAAIHEARPEHDDPRGLLPN